MMISIWIDPFIDPEYIGFYNLDKRNITNKEKITHGMSDNKENTNPIIPILDGTIIKTPDIKPMIPVFLL